MALVAPIAHFFSSNSSVCSSDMLCFLLRCSSLAYLYGSSCSSDSYVFSPPARGFQWPPLVPSYLNGFYMGRLLLMAWLSWWPCSCFFMDLLCFPLASYHHLVSRILPYWHQWQPRSTQGSLYLGVINYVYVFSTWWHVHYKVLGTSKFHCLVSSTVKCSSSIIFLIIEWV